VGKANRKSIKSAVSTESGCGEPSAIAVGYASWVKNVIAPALVELYLREKAQQGGGKRA